MWSYKEDALIFPFFASCGTPFLNYVIRYILPNAESREEHEKDYVTKGCEVMGVFVPKSSQNHGKFNFQAIVKKANRLTN